MKILGYQIFLHFLSIQTPTSKRLIEASRAATKPYSGLQLRVLHQPGDIGLNLGRPKFSKLLGLPLFPHAGKTWAACFMAEEGFYGRNGSGSVVAGEKGA